MPATPPDPPRDVSAIPRTQAMPLWSSGWAFTIAFSFCATFLYAFFAETISIPANKETRIVALIGICGAFVLLLCCATDHFSKLDQRRMRDLYLNGVAARARVTSIHTEMNADGFDGPATWTDYVVWEFTADGRVFRGRSFRYRLPNCSAGDDVWILYSPHNPLSSEAWVEFSHFYSAARSGAV